MLAPKKVVPKTFDGGTLESYVASYAPNNLIGAVDLGAKLAD
jgi:hypothetical protein